MDEKIIGDLSHEELEEALGPAHVDQLKTKGRPKGGTKDPAKEPPKKKRVRRPSKLPLPAPEPAHVDEIQRFSRTHAMGLCSCLLEMAHTRNLAPSSRIKAITTLLDLAGFTMEGKRSPAAELTGMKDSEFKATFKKIISATTEEEKETKEINH